MPELLQALLDEQDRLRPMLERLLALAALWADPAPGGEATEDTTTQGGTINMPNDDPAAGAGAGRVAARDPAGVMTGTGSANASPPTSGSASGAMPVERPAGLHGRGAAGIDAAAGAVAARDPAEVTGSGSADAPLLTSGPASGAMPVVRPAGLHGRAAAGTDAAPGTAAGAVAARDPAGVNGSGSAEASLPAPGSASGAMPVVRLAGLRRRGSTGAAVGAAAGAFVPSVASRSPSLPDSAATTGAARASQGAAAVQGVAGPAAAAWIFGVLSAASAAPGWASPLAGATEAGGAMVGAPAVGGAALGGAVGRAAWATAGGPSLPVAGGSAVGSTAGGAALGLRDYGAPQDPPGDALEERIADLLERAASEAGIVLP